MDDECDNVPFLIMHAETLGKCGMPATRELLLEAASEIVRLRDRVRELERQREQVASE